MNVSKALLFSVLPLFLIAVAAPELTSDVVVSLKWFVLCPVSALDG